MLISATDPSPTTHVSECQYICHMISSKYVLRISRITPPHTHIQQEGHAGIISDGAGSFQSVLFVLKFYANYGFVFQ